MKSEDCFRNNYNLNEVIIISFLNLILSTILIIINMKSYFINLGYFFGGVGIVNAGAYT